MDEQGNQTTFTETCPAFTTDRDLMNILSSSIFSCVCLQEDLYYNKRWWQIYFSRIEKRASYFNSHLNSTENSSWHTLLFSWRKYASSFTKSDEVMRNRAIRSFVMPWKVTLFRIRSVSSVCRLSLLPWHQFHHWFSSHLIFFSCSFLESYHVDNKKHQKVDPPEECASLSDFSCNLKARQQR
jgi:hypothetical protein